MPESAAIQVKEARLQSLGERPTQFTFFGVLSMFQDEPSNSSFTRNAPEFFFFFNLQSLATDEFNSEQQISMGVL